MDRGGRALREAVQQYLDAIESEPGHSWLSAAARALEESSRRGYAGALRRLRKRIREQFGASPRQVLELEIREMVASENAEGNVKKLLSACRQLDKLRLHPRIVETRDWQVVKWLAKRRVRGESALVLWAPMELFVRLAEQIVDLASAEIVVFACISVACLLRVGEAATVHTGTRGDVRFNSEKGRPGSWDVEVGPWTKWWVLFFWEIRRLKHGRADLPFSFQDATKLQAGWKKIVGGSDFEGYSWHALRRCGAAVLWFWGARIQAVMLAGEWVTPSVAKDYCHPTHAWSCERRMHLPVSVDWVWGGDRRRDPVQVRRTVCGQSVGAMGQNRSARRCTSAMPWDPGECGRLKETEKKQIPGAHECHARRIRQRVQQRRRIPVHGV